MTLFIIATPIGNLADITLRALDTLKKVKFICAENPRHSQRLLKHYKIETSLKPLSQTMGALERGEDVALISDAGTPAISDPGSKIVSEALAKDHIVVPIPGPSALVTALSVAGVGFNRFLFLGFLPHKKGRTKMIKEMISSQRPVVFYESPHRIFKILGLLPRDREVVVCRELTKLYETIYRGKVGEILEILKQKKVRGEFVVLLK